MRISPALEHYVLYIDILFLFFDSALGRGSERYGRYSASSTAIHTSVRIEDRGAPIAQA